MNSTRLSTDRLAAAAVVALVLLIQGPLFLKSPLGPDPVMYDLQAQLVERGGVLYRDLLEPNLPGAVWVHLAVRSIAGWSNEVLRAFDLAWFCLGTWLAARLMSSDARVRALLIAGMLTAYATVSEWCHCQRDVWMLPLVLAAVHLRLLRLRPRRAGGVSPLMADTSSDSHLPNSVLAILEGMLWGAAVWLKPHVVIPAALVVAAGCLSARKFWLLDHGCALLGGALVGVAGVLWLMNHNSWSPLWTMLTEWNRDYVAASANRWSWGRLWAVQERLAPWSFVHFAAVPATLWILAHARRDSAKNPILAALYLGWLTQSLLLQHLFEYVHFPAIVLGAMVLSVLPWPRRSVSWTGFRFAAAAVVVLMAGIAIRGEQLALWPKCVGGASSPELRASLARLPLPEWPHLADVERFLKSQHVRDGELTAYHTHTIHLYPALGVMPSTRFAFTETHLRLFPARAAEIAAELERSRQRFVVSDLLEAGLDPEIAVDDSDPDNWRRACPSAGLCVFPFDQPVVFRSGPYLVHAVTAPVGPMETGFFPLAAKTAGL